MIQIESHEVLKMMSQTAVAHTIRFNFTGVNYCFLTSVSGRFYEHLLEAVIAIMHLVELTAELD